MTATWDHSSHQQFYDYYAGASQGQETFERFRSIRDCVLRILERHHSCAYPLEVADIGCGAGSQSMMWAELGHHVHGLDVNEALLALARERAASAGHSIDFQVGSAVQLPWADASLDVCLVIELLEHVADWKACIGECARVLRTGGVLFLTTTNKLCPRQQEFNLPIYSWYPEPLKRYFESIAVTTHPQIVNFAKYPAVNWFSFYSLRATLKQLGFECQDRFDIMNTSMKNFVIRILIASVQIIPLLGWLAHMTTSGTIIAAIKVRSTP